MSLIPAFEIGLWNAWLLMLYLPLHPLIMILIDKAVGTGDILKKMGTPLAPSNKTQKRVSNLFTPVICVAFIYSIFLPLKLGTIWLYIGLPIYLLGLIMFIIPMANIATTPHGEPFTKGLYRCSRHPMYLWGNVIHIGVSIASASWVFLLLTIAIIILQLSLAIAEERGCLEKYGDAYRDYMNRTPRLIGIPKSRER